MSCPIVIKTIDSLEKKGIYEHDTSRVLNKPAFIAYNDKWSQIAKDKFNLTNVDKMFNIVDGGLKKMLSGSSYLRDNTESITRAFVNQDFFNELQEKYDLANKPADTTINRIKQVNNKQKIEVKPGVQELFNENPELAHTVYEALGVKQANISFNIEPFGKSIDNIDVIKDGKKIGYVQISKNNNTKTLIVTGIELKEKGFGKNVYLKLQQQYPDFTIKSDSKNLSEAAIKMWDSLVSKKLATKQGDRQYTLNTQQAQQVYSQYLDSIGVTNIAYHHSEEDISEFTSSSERYFQKELKKKNKYIPKLDDIVFLVKKPLTEEFMSKRKFIGSWGLKTPKTLQFSAGEKIGEGVHPGIDKGIFAGIEGNYDAIDFGKIRDNKTWSEVIAITNPKNAIKLGSKTDIEGFKEFVKTPIKINLLNRDFNVDDLSNDLNLETQC